MLSTFHNECIAQQFKLKGKVTNSKLEPLSYVTVQIKEMQIGTRTNNKGEFEFQLYEGEYELVFSLLGYEKQSIKLIHQQDEKPVNIILLESKNELNEIKIVNFKKDRAEEIIRNVVQQKNKIQNTCKSYSVDIYIRATEQSESQLTKKEARLKQKDSTKILLDNMSMSEVSLKLDYEFPNKIKEKRVAVKNRGTTDGLFYLTTTDGNFDLYDNLMKIPSLSETPILSPISFSGLVSYKYKTKRITKKDNYTIYTISFTPSKMGNAMISGEVDIVDTSWTIIHADYSFPKFHMPEYDYFQVTQNFEFVNNKAWLPINQEFTYFSKNGNSKANGKTLVTFENYKLDTAFKKKYFNNELSATTLEAYDKDSTFWNTTRKIPLNEKEINFIQKSDSTYRAQNSKEYLDSVDKAENKVRVLEVLFLGVDHYDRKHDLKWFINPLLNVYRPFFPGGGRIGIGGNVNYVSKYKKKTFAIADINYGIYNKDIMGEVRLRHTYNPFSQGTINFNIGKTFDLIFLGDAYINLLRRSNFYIKNRIELSHSVELLNGLRFEIGGEFARRESVNSLQLTRTYDSLFKDGTFLQDPIDFKPYNAFFGNVTLEYTPMQTYIREPYEKIILGSKYPTLYVTWRKGIPGILNSIVNFDYLEFGLKQQLKLGLAGISEYQFMSGEFLNQKNLQYVDYKFISRGNPGLFNNPMRSFQSLDSTFPIFKRFYEGHYIHHFNGALLNKIPILKELQLLEVAGGGFLLVPERNLRYVEAYIGVEKVIRFFKERFKIGFYYAGSLANKNNTPFQFKIGLDAFNKTKNSWY